MSIPELTRISTILEKHESAILSEWLKARPSAGVVRTGAPAEQEKSKALLRSIIDSLRKASSADIATPDWEAVRENLAIISRSRAQQGSTPEETAAFVFALKEPIFTRLAAEFKDNAEELARHMWLVFALVDRLGLYTVRIHQSGREDIILRQQQEMLELSTPVVELWRGIVAVPLIGTLDSQRTQVVMETLLQKIVDTGAPIAIIDITGVPTVDTLVAQHLMKTIAAARLMGADCIISGIRPQIAQTIVHLGVALGDVVTRATLAGAFAVALERTGLTISSRQTA